MKFQGSQQAQLATVGACPNAFLCSSSRARQVCSNNLGAHSSSRGSMVRLQGSQQGLFHFNHFSLLVQLARVADQKWLKTHIWQGARKALFQMCHFIMGPMDHKSTRPLSLPWFNHFSPAPATSWIKNGKNHVLHDVPL